MPATRPALCSTTRPPPTWIRPSLCRIFTSDCWQSVRRLRRRLDASSDERSPSLTVKTHREFFSSVEGLAARPSSRSAPLSVPTDEARLDLPITQYSQG